MKTLCEDHPQIGESELIRNQCPRCVADLRTQVVQLTEERDEAQVMANLAALKGVQLQAQVVTLTEDEALLNKDIIRLEAQVAQLTEERLDSCVTCGVDIGGEHDCASASPYIEALVAQVATLSEKEAAMCPTCGWAARQNPWGGTGRCVNKAFHEGYESFCKHGVYLGDANPNRPCWQCAALAQQLADEDVRGPDPQAVDPELMKLLGDPTEPATCPNGCIFIAAAYINPGTDKACNWPGHAEATTQTCINGNPLDGHGHVAGACYDKLDDAGAEATTTPKENRGG